MIRATAPVRICDIGGWTDTWFGGPGRVVHVAVRPGVEVTVEAGGGPGAVVIDVEDFGDRYSIVPGDPSRGRRHPLLEAALDAVPPPDDIGAEIHVRSFVPPGSGLGTSAAIAVALLGALHELRSDEPSPRELAYGAHRLEVNVLGQESGIQDQLAAAFGGINFVEVEPYPEAKVRRLPDWPELAQCFTTVSLGRPHDSSAVHRQVIEDARRRGPEVFEALRQAALSARRAVVVQDAAAFGRAMLDGTDAQRRLHPTLVSSDADEVFGRANDHGAFGWKVNGAGGPGGSVTVLHPSSAARSAFEGALAGTPYRVLALEPSPSGLEVEGSL
ncbi:MAG TPA: hypothetical protein VKR22_04960 [Acidimicrobiales bacterium]|nr:hypothetical protein [Acidimicrobiales bacterium]